MPDLYESLSPILLRDLARERSIGNRPDQQHTAPQHGGGLTSRAGSMLRLIGHQVARSLPSGPRRHGEARSAS